MAWGTVGSFFKLSAPVSGLDCIVRDRLLRHTGSLVVDHGLGGAWTSALAVLRLSCS